MTLRTVLVLVPLVLGAAAPSAPAQCERQAFEFEATPGFPPAFGAALSMSDDGRTLLVGAPKALPGGEVRVYERIQADWIEVQVIPGPFDRKGLGHAVALSGDGRTALVGSYADFFSESGEVHVLERDASGWRETARLLAEPGREADSFGASVGLSFTGARAVVGARADGANGLNAGAAYVFERGPSGWELGDVLAPDAPLAGDAFGSAVTLSDTGTTLLVAAVSRNIGNGAAFAFELMGGEWTQTAAFAGSPDAFLLDAFGSSVSLSADGSVAAIGANSLFSLEGSFLEVHVRDDAGWSLDERVFAEARDAPNGFGNGCRLSNDGQRLLVGASQRAGTLAQQGSAALLVRGPGGWVEGPAIEPSTPEAFGSFGRALALSGDGTRAAIASQRGFVFSTPGIAYTYDLGLCTTPVTVDLDSMTTLEIDAGVDHAGAPYWVLGSVTGTDPGFPLGAGKRIPLVADDYTAWLAPPGASGLLLGGRGQLDANGRATVRLTPTMEFFEALTIGRLYHAALVFGPDGLWASNESVAVIVY